MKPSDIVSVKHDQYCILGRIVMPPYINQSHIILQSYTHTNSTTGRFGVLWSVNRPEGSILQASFSTRSAVTSLFIERPFRHGPRGPIPNKSRSEIERICHRQVAVAPSVTEQNDDKTTRWRHDDTIAREQFRFRRSTKCAFHEITNIMT